MEPTFNQVKRRPWNHPRFWLGTAVLPSLAGIGLSAARVPLGGVAHPALMIVAWCLMGLAAVCLGFGRRRPGPPAEFLMAASFLAGVMGFGMLIWLTNAVPSPTRLFSLEAALAMLAGIQAAGTALLLQNGRLGDVGAQIRQDFRYGFLIPLICALCFRLGNPTNIATDIMLSIAAGLLCLSGVFFWRWARVLLGCGTAREACLAAEVSEAAQANETIKTSEAAVIDEASETAEAAGGFGMDAAEAGAAISAEGQIPPLTSTHLPKEWKAKRGVVWIVLFGILFPQIGLALNQGMDGAFLNASHPLFYIIAAGNGLLMLRAHKGPAMLPRLYFQGIGYCYVLYFAVLFLPVMAYGLMGVLLLGLGVLLLTPAVLMVLY